MPLPDNPVQPAPAPTTTAEYLASLRQKNVGQAEAPAKELKPADLGYQQIDRVEGQARLDEQNNPKPGIIADVAMAIPNGISKAIVNTENFVQDVTGSGTPQGNFQQVLAGDVGSGLGLPAEGAQTAPGQLVQGVSQFTSEFLGLGKFARLAKGASLGLKFTKAAVQTGAAQAIGFDPYEARLSNLIQEHPALANPITSFLAADPKNSKASNRFRSFLEGAGLGAAAEGLFAALGLLKQGRAIKAAKGDEAAAKFMQENTESVAVTAPAPEVPPTSAETAPVEAPAELITLADEWAAAEKDVRRAQRQDPHLLDDARSARFDAETTFRSAAEKSNISAETFDRLVERAKRTQTANPDAASNTLLSPEQAQSIKDNFAQNVKNGAPLEGLTDLNADHLLLTQAPLRMIEEVSQALKEPFDKLKGGKQTLNSIFENADIAGQDPLAVMAKSGQQAKEAGDWAIQQTAQRIVVATYTRASASLAQELNAKAAAGLITTEDDLKLLGLMQKHAEAQGDLIAIKSGHARALGAGRIDIAGNVPDQLDALAPKADPLVKPKPTAQDLLKDILAQPDGSERLRQMALFNAELADNPKGMGMIARAVSNGLGLHNNLWMNAILSRPVSLIRDTIGNTIATVTPPIEKMIGGVRRVDPIAIKEGARTFHALGESFVEALEMAKVSFDSGLSFIDPQHTFTAAQKTLLSAVPGESMWANGIRYLGLVAEMPTRLRMASDEFFKQINTRAFIRFKARGLADELKIPDHEVGAFVQKKLDESISQETGKSLSDSATDYGQHATFTQPLDPERFAGGYENWVNNNPALRLVTPFVKTPVNLYRWSGQHSPFLAAASSEFRTMWKAGGVQRAQAEGMLATGSVIWGSGLYLAAKGLICGGGPRDPDQNKLWKQAGNVPYSAQMGDRRVSYLSLDPGVATIFGLIGDYHENAGQLTEDGRTSMAGAMLLAMAKNITNKSMLTGIAQMTSALTATGNNSSAMDKFIRSRMASYVPQGIKDITEALPHDATFATDNPYLREVMSWADAMYAKTPFDTSADYRNMFGEKVLMPAGLGEDTISPFITAKENPDPVIKELAKYPSGFSRPSPNLSENVKLDSKQYSERMAELDKPIRAFGGNTLKQELADVIKSDLYKEASENFTTRFNGLSEKKMLLVHRIQKAYEATERSYLDNNPDVAERVQADRSAAHDVKLNGIDAAPENPLDLLNKYKR
jgi:hypothetical protein